MEHNIFRNINSELNDFTGNEQYYRHFLGKLFTDGVHHLREIFKCFWLIDDIMVYATTTVTDEIQVWRLKRVLTIKITLLLIELIVSIWYARMVMITFCFPSRFHSVILRVTK